MEIEIGQVWTDGETTVEVTGVDPITLAVTGECAGAYACAEWEGVDPRDLVGFVLHCRGVVPGVQAMGEGT